MVMMMLNSEDIENCDLRRTTKRWFKYQLMQMEMEKTRLEYLLRNEIKNNTELQKKIKMLEFENEDIKEKLKNDNK